MYAQSLHKRVEKQKEHANRSLASWFIGKFSKKTQYLRDQDEETAQVERARRHNGAATTSTSSSGSTNRSRSTNNSQTKPGRISAVAAAAQKPQRQHSFLRAQLLEMKRESAETLLSVQAKRMAGETVDNASVRLGTQLGIDNSDDEDYALDDSDDDVESVCSVDEIDDAIAELNTADFRAIRKEKWLRKQAAAVATATDRMGTRTERTRSSSSSRRRSSADHVEDDEDEDEDDKENDSVAALNVRMGRATQMYAEALSQIDHALHPDAHAGEEEEPQPLFLGTKKGPKSEWI